MCEEYFCPLLFVDLLRPRGEKCLGIWDTGTYYLLRKPQAVKRKLMELVAKRCSLLESS